MGTSDIKENKQRFFLKLFSFYDLSGRNLAVKQFTEQSSTQTGLDSKNSVDGGDGTDAAPAIKRETCSRTERSGIDETNWWRILFSHGVHINTLQIFGLRYDIQPTDTTYSGLLFFFLNIEQNVTSTFSFFLYKVWFIYLYNYTYIYIYIYVGVCVYIL